MAHSLKGLALALLVLVCFSCYSNAEEFVEPGSDGTTKHTIYDDGRVQIDLPFDFTMYDKTFTTSWMMSNGVVVMMGTNINTNAPFQHFCCNGQDVASMAANGQLPGQPYFNYTIAALWTDLIDLNVDVTGDGVADSGFFTKEIDSDGDGQIDTLRYYWRYIAEFYNANNLNTFGVEINDANAIEIHHFDINIVNHTVTTGIFGDTNAGEIQQFEYQYAMDESGTSVYTFNLTAACAANPLISPTCDGYADAYAELLYTNACAADPLYDSGCPGYATAYYNQQCTANPLYDSGCTGYEEAYFTQQCTLNALYDENCDGYETAYYNEYIAPTLEEQANEAAGLDTSTDTSTDFAVVDPVESLTEVSITGDATVDEALRDINENTFTEPGGILGMDNPFEETAPFEETIADTTDGDFGEGGGDSRSAEETGGDTQEEIIEIAALEEEQEEPEEREERDAEGENESGSDVDERVDDSGNEEGPGSEPDNELSDSEGSSNEDSEGDSESGKSDSKSEKKESKREKLKKAVAKRAMQLADRMSKAKSIEMQQAVQAQVLALINFVPDFAKYGGNITGGYYPDVGGYQDSQLPENNRGLRNGLAQQLLHEKMVDMQYERD